MEILVISLLGTDGSSQDTKAEVAEILKRDDVERNENGEVALHGHTYFAWTHALPTGSE